MKLENGTFCPLIKKDCVGLKCAWFVKLRGMDRNTGEEIDDWYCSITILPMLLIENTQIERETGAAVESFRNEMKKDNATNLKLQALAAAKALSNEDLNLIANMKDVTDG